MIMIGNQESQELHVIFGTGPAGCALADELLARQRRVRLVNRSGKGAIPAGAELVKGDALAFDAVRELTRSAAVVYHCANVPYQDQVRVMPAMQQSIIEGAAASGAKLVVTDTLYMYGETGGKTITENTEFSATTRKGRMRAELAKNYLKAHADGKLPIALARAADFYGPRVLNSAFGDRVLPFALAGKPVQLMGNIDLPHSFSYIGDVARTMAVLGESAQSFGRAWHVPVTPPDVTQRAMVKMVEKALNQPIKITAFPKLLIRAFGLFNPFMREFVEMFYQYEEPQIVDASRVRETFGLHATPLEDAIRNTVRWYQMRIA